ncbi:MAG: ABC transporter permease, partial [Geminicoccaceae bacterium]
GYRGAALMETARSYGATAWLAFFEIYGWAALTKILACIRLRFLREVKGVVIGKLLVSIVGFGRSFEIYSSKS